MMDPSAVVEPFETLPFDGTDYRGWSCRFAAFLSLMDLEDAIHPPKEEEEGGGPITADMRARNKKAYRHIALAMDDPVSLYLVLGATSRRFSDDDDEEEEECGDAPLAWSLLRDKWDPKTDAAKEERLHKDKGGPNKAVDKHRLLVQFYHTKMDDVTRDPAAFVSELTKIQKRLNAMGESISDDSLMGHVLYHLPEEYETIGALLLRDSTKTVESMKDELHHKYERLILSGKIQQRAPGRGPGAGPARRFAISCNFCGKEGHAASDCYSKKKKTLQEIQGSRTGRKIRGNCFYCNKPGHREADCRKKRADDAASTRRGSTDRGVVRADVAFCAYGAMSGAPGDYDKDLWIY
jgi:hypothetical protein